jgi:hypothetical protein
MLQTSNEPNIDFANLYLKSDLSEALDDDCGLVAQFQDYCQQQFFKS